MEWLNYHHLYYFWIVCKEGGFSKAALKLRIAQSAVSLQVSKLEDHLGEKLMERGPRGFKLTEAGQVTLAQAEEIFRQGNDLLQYFRSGKMKSSFRVGALGGLSKNLQLKILSNVLSDSKTELSLEVGDAAVLIDRLVNYKLDAVLSDVPIPSSAAEPLTQTEIAVEAVCLVSRIRPKKVDSDTLPAFLSKGLYLPAQSSPITSALLDFVSAEVKIPYIRGFIDDIAFLRLLALETDCLIAIPKIGIRRELEAGELHIVHEFKKIKQSYFLVYRQKGKRHPMLNLLLKG
ncbi:MAG: LysR family transcriptional regulator [Bdellovibrio sp.]|nr:LysR family transcriptional regulator [Bdellovibrio sp.]